MYYICISLKRGILIIFCFIYFLSSVGVGLNLHYCGSKLVSVSIHHTDEKNRCGNKMKKSKKMNCCKEKSVTYKINDTQDSGNKIFSLKNNIQAVDIFYYPVIDLFNVQPILFFNQKQGEPPDINYNYTYLLNRVFRI